MIKLKRKGSKKELRLCLGKQDKVEISYDYYSEYHNPRDWFIQWGSSESDIPRGSFVWLVILGLSVVVFANKTPV